ncbi:MAG: putative porin [Bacteroidales bacterium]|nr:putative porin [Bacteroidales bacterium]
MLRSFLPIIFLFLLGTESIISQTISIKKDSIFRILKFNLSESLRKDSIPFDSTLNKITFLNPYMPDDYLYTYCTRSGNPFISNLITDRISDKYTFYPLGSFGQLVQNIYNSNYYFISNAPFTSITYKFQGVVQSKDEMVDVLFTRRVSKSSHIGFTYRLFSNKAETDFQRANDHSFYLYWVTTKKSYFQITQFYYNTFEYNETGGIAADSLINYSSSDFYGTEVRLNNATSKLLHWGAHTTQQWLLNKTLGPRNDSSELKNASVAYMFSIESNKKLYKEANSNPSFYKNYFSKNGSLTDSLTLWQATNKIQINAPNFSKYLPDLRASLSYTFYESFHGKNIDTLVFALPSKSWQNYSQLWIQGEAGYQFSKFIANVNWKSCILGYGWGDQELKGVIHFKGSSDSSSYFLLRAASSAQTPSFMLKSVFLNHYLWNKGDSLKRQFNQQIGGEVYFRPMRIKLGLDYHLFNHYLYFDQNGINQISEWLQAIQLSGENLLNFYGFSLKSKFWIQFFDEKYFQLPKWGIFQTAAYTHTFIFSTGGRLNTRFGVDFKYYSSYLPDTYLPPLGVFALSDPNDNSISYAGNYPIFNVHLTFKVKNVSFYIKYGHFNAWWNRRTFVAAHYPMLPSTISYGINWMFYDW